MVTQKFAIKLIEAERLLVESGRSLLSVSLNGTPLSWVCQCGYEGKSSIYDILKGRKCFRCRRKGRQPRKPRILQIGTRSGDLEVTGNLGVVNGFSMVSVRNVKTRITGVMRPNDFERQKVKLLDAESIKKVIRDNGINRKGHKNSKNSKYTWGDIALKVKKLGWIPQNLPNDEEAVFDSTNKNRWHFICRCGRDFCCSINQIQSGQRTSCGCSKMGAQMSVADFIRPYFPDLILNDRSRLDGYELDIYIPSKEIAIEYNGLYWHSEEKVGKKYHQKKMDSCKKSGIRLLSVFENEWLLRPESVRAYVLSVLGVCSNKTQGRKLVLDKAIKWSVAKEFLDNNHIQGACPSGQYVAGLLSPGGELVSLLVCRMSYTRNAITQARSKRWELTRYCVKNDLMVVGGFQRLWKSFQRDCNPDRVVSFSDNRWSVGGIYERNGFVLDKTLEPSYWYFKKHEAKKLYHKCRFQKKNIQGILPSETESAAMKRLGYDRIWDCGLTRWVWSAPLAV